ncbi:chromosome partitioning protein [Monaibacterium marinum]|uniref:Chromosome partitioning protein n=1 Tax=Pontivivens marinum TaxID=1690039 RepID=A0A2C9CU93_9RHOB|nr:ParA family protein [Monaibacterium marinum]SOH94695.1 chromosome partitioning protein [Monaibacterium marinum]
MGRIITFAQQKGGAGKTTVLTQLAHHWLATGVTVALVDLDPQGSLSRWASMRGDMECTASSDWKAGSDIRAAARKADLVLVDCPGNADILLRATIRDSDLVVAPAQPSMMDLWALEPVVEMARKEKTPLRVLLNRVPPTGRAAQDARDVVTADLLDEQMGNRVVFQQAFAVGKAAAELQPRSKAASEVAAIAAALDAIE